MGDVPVHTLHPDSRKIVAALAFLITESERKNYSPTQYDLIKALFLADRSHLNEWGRPVTYDNYVAMTHGPVPSLAYDFLKLNEYKMRQFGLDAFPWERTALSGGRFNYTPLEGMEFDEILSPSDQEALKSSLATIRKLSFGQIRRLTHEDQAYVEAWGRRNGSAASPMSLGLLFDEPNFEYAEHLSEFSPNVQSG